jgi:hypothetical protein
MIFHVTCHVASAISEGDVLAAQLKRRAETFRVVTDENRTNSAAIARCSEKRLHAFFLRATHISECRERRKVLVEGARLI